MKRIVVVQTAFLGDLLLSLPLLKWARELWPDSQITLVCRRGLGSFFLKTEVVHEVLEIEKGKASTYRAARQKLNERQIDLLISPHTSFRTTLLCFRIKASAKVSFKKPWNFFVFTKRLEWPRAWPEALRVLSLLTPWAPILAEHLSKSGVNFNEKGALNRLISVPDWASMSLVENLDQDPLRREFPTLARCTQKAMIGDKRILIFPGSVWRTKRWTAEGFLQVAQGLQKDGYQVVWMGGPGEEQLANDLGQRSPGSLVLAGKTSVLQSCLLMRKSRLVICNDSAASHMAAATETPVLSIFGPTVLGFGYRPWSSKAYVIEKSDLGCRPCGPHGGKKCPIKTHVCMTRISSEEVLRLSREILGLVQE